MGFCCFKNKVLSQNFFFPIDISLIQSLDILLLSTSKAKTTHTLNLQFYLATNYKFTLSTRIKRTYFLLFQLPLFHSHTDQYRYTIDPEQRNILNNVTVMRRVNTWTSFGWFLILIGKCYFISWIFPPNSFTHLIRRCNVYSSNLSVFMCLMWAGWKSNIDENQ